MWETLKWLEGPEPVIAFQRRCGIIPRPAKNAKQQNGVANGSRPTNGKANGFMNGDAKHYQNGDACGHGDYSNGHAYKLRSRTVEPSMDTDDVVLNGDPACPVSQELTEDSAEDSESSTSGSEVEDANRKELTTCDVTNAFLYYLFCFGANLGNEVFYCAFFPFWLWNVDGFVGRRVCYIWCAIMYFGQAAKDIIRWPRPASPPVVRMEKRYELEYGMPSTHAMVGAAVPFSLLVFTWSRYEYEHVSALALATAWCTLVCLSRLYLGMHTVLDIIAGLLFAGLILAIMHPLLDILDTFILSHPYSPAAVIVVSLLMCIFYPTLDKWSTARGDTTMILAVGVGVCLASWVNFQWEIYLITTDLPPYGIKIPNAEYFGTMMLRTMLGIVILIATRTVMKALTYHMLCYLFGYKKENRSLQHLIVELPYKYITYTMVAFNVVYFAPAVFRYVGIERTTVHTEY